MPRRLFLAPSHGRTGIFPQRAISVNLLTYVIKPLYNRQDKKKCPLGEAMPEGAAEKLMEEIIKDIAAAEEEAARIKAEAQKRAQELVADAEREARALSERTEEELKAYRDEQAKRAGAEASAEYDAAVAAARREAEAETSRLLENTDAAVGRIAGRILSDR